MTSPKRHSHALHIPPLVGPGKKGFLSSSLESRLILTANVKEGHRSILLSTSLASNDESRRGKGKAPTCGPCHLDDSTKPRICCCCCFCGWSMCVKVHRDVDAATLHNGTPHAYHVSRTSFPSFFFPFAPRTWPACVKHAQFSMDEKEKRKTRIERAGSRTRINNNNNALWPQNVFAQELLFTDTHIWSRDPVIIFTPSLVPPFPYCVCVIVFSFCQQTRLRYICINRKEAKKEKERMSRLRLSLKEKKEKRLGDSVVGASRVMDRIGASFLRLCLSVCCRVRVKKRKAAARAIPINC